MRNPVHPCLITFLVRLRYPTRNPVQPGMITFIHVHHCSSTLSYAERRPARYDHVYPRSPLFVYVILRGTPSSSIWHVYRRLGPCSSRLSYTEWTEPRLASFDLVFPRWPLIAYVILRRTPFSTVRPCLSTFTFVNIINNNVRLRLSYAEPRLALFELVYPRWPLVGPCSPTLSYAEPGLAPLDHIYPRSPLFVYVILHEAPFRSVLKTMFIHVHPCSSQPRSQDFSLTPPTD